MHSASLRATGRILELTLADLAMTEAEASALLASEGIDLGDDLSKVVARAEGWPAAIYLVALAIKVGATKESALQIGGDDWYIADYLQEQVLSRLTPDRLDFLVKSSILDQMSAPLCDHTLQTTGSDRRLRKLEASNMLVVPVDRSRTWFRYHTLLRDHLTTELERRSPDEIAGLHLRASEWFESRDMIESAIHHAQRAGDGQRAAPLIARIIRTVYATGGSDTVRSWIDWYERTGRIAEAPNLAPIAAIAEALDGRADEAERWMTIVDGTTGDRYRNPIGRLARSIIAPRDLESMLDDATAASEALRDTDWLPAALLVCALAKLWMDEVDQADEMLDRVIRIGEERGAPPATSYALATRAAISHGRGQYDAAEGLTSRAVELVRRHHIERMATSCLPFVMDAQCAAHRGAIDTARSRLNEVAGVRPRLTRVVPVVAMATLLELASAYVAIADVSGARGVMRDLVAISLPQLGTLTTRRAQLEASLAALPTGNVGVSTLTTAELRLLPLLATNLSFPEIGERLFVSRHTVKTQAMSIYRKLDVSSRSDAVTRLRELGLLGS
jgi:LuxR family maltose regulon positive regulatory protein